MSDKVQTNSLATFAKTNVKDSIANALTTKLIAEATQDASAEGPEAFSKSTFSRSHGIFNVEEHGVAAGVQRLDKAALRSVREALSSR